MEEGRIFDVEDSADGVPQRRVLVGPVLPPLLVPGFQDLQLIQATSQARIDLPIEGRRR